MSHGPNGEAEDSNGFLLQCILACSLTALRQGMNSEIQHLMVIYDKLTLHPPPAVTPVALPAPEPMQVDSYHLTPAERQQRIQLRLCLYCGGDDHQITICPVLAPRPAVSTIQLLTKKAHLTRTTVYILTRYASVSAQVLIDSGLAGNFISHCLLQELHVQRKRCNQALKIQTILGKLLG